MPFKVQVGPPQISIHQGQTVLISEESGRIGWPGDKGLYFFDTRVISSWAMYANGEPWDLLNGGTISYYASRIFLTNRSLLTELKTRAAGSFQSLALQEKTGFPFERERVCVCVAVRESCGVACEPFAPTIAPVRGSRQ